MTSRTTQYPPHKFHVWRVRKRLPDGTFAACTYQSNCGPVTSAHVRTAPSVRKWIGSDELVMIHGKGMIEHGVTKNESFSLT